MPPSISDQGYSACMSLHMPSLVNYFVQGPLVMNNVLVSKVNICEVPGILRRINIL